VQLSFSLTFQIDASDAQRDASWLGVCSHSSFGKFFE